MSIADFIHIDPIKKLKFLALGDSYTIGEGVRQDQSWPCILVQTLNNNGISFEKPRILAKTGWTTDELILALEKSAIDETFDLVSLLIGVNNQYRKLSLDQFKKDFLYLIEKAICLADNKPNKVMVLSIPDWGVSPYARSENTAIIAGEIDAFNTEIKSICADANCGYLNITTLSRTALNKIEFFADDGLHFSDKMHEKWVELIFKSYFI